MAKTVLITGASSGIGRSTALFFAEKGWTVIATMRSPEKANLGHQNIHVLKLDVTDNASIEHAITEALKKFNTIDVLINNAGYSLLGAFEACSPEQIQRQFETNVFGLMAMTRAVLPHFRERQTGVIVNVASIGGKLTFPLYSLYHSTKWAVEGFSDSLQYELEPFNIRIKIIEPGPIKTDFYHRSTDLATLPNLTVYDAFIAKVMPQIKKAGERGESPDRVAEVIYRASTDGTSRLRYPSDREGRLLLFLRTFLPDSAFSKLVRKTVIDAK
jgi:NADP-dependent 3-hydroxy acid dehydrogenase YdfG